jgi:hypothetical protein
MVRFVYKNLWRDAIALSASSEKAQFPKENTQEDIVTMSWRSNGTVSNEIFVADFGVASEYNFVALLGHNITSAATITIYGADNSGFTTGVVSQNLTHNGNNIFTFLASTYSKRYFRIQIQDASNPAGYLQVGTIIVGKYVELNRHFGAYSKALVDESEVEKSPTGNLFTVQARTMLQRWSLPFTGLDDNSAAAIELMVAEVGIRKALIFCTDPTTPNSTSYWVHFVEPPAKECRHSGYWSATFELEEVV